MYEYKKNCRSATTKITSRGIETTDDYMEHFANHYQKENNISYEEYEALNCALLRTGLIYTKPFVRETKYDLSPLFYKIIRLVDFKDALDKEDI